MTKSPAKRRVLTVVMDGIGISPVTYGNAVAHAHTPNMQWLRGSAGYLELAAHGKAVGLPSDSDIGNSEVGHNALGAGRVFDQGAKLVRNAIESGSLFAGETWREAIKRVKGGNRTLHFMGLLSDGNVHSHENHLHAMLRQAKKEGVRRVRLHLLLDGRDVGEKTAEVYSARLEKLLGELNAGGFDARVASGGGRMLITMDRYEADWPMVQRGWECHVHGRGQPFPSLTAAIDEFRKDPALTDQYLPAFVITESSSGNTPCGTINDGDAVILFNFRGDRAIEISRAFTEKDFNKFDRGRCPDVFYAGMMEYDGDLKIPSRYLVDPPAIDNTLGEFLASSGVRQFACSETQKFGHVTYFWNGNRSGWFDKSIEEYVEVPSDNIRFEFKPWMKAAEICDETVKRMLAGSFDFGRINFANGDMVGHTGDFDAAVEAVSTVDLMLGRLIAAARKSGVILLITADHGNADEMFDVKPPKDGSDPYPYLPVHDRPRPKTSHTLSAVPLYIFDPNGPVTMRNDVARPGLANVANTALSLLGMAPRDVYLPSLVQGCRS
ncbi:2,3-bisphosphoglycerate-independent phosphoglycerate mutase [bacterium]|nr:2,3-bisphosphoglycerate-independent phosphoglycerate mutase [bacterium]